MKMDIYDIILWLIIQLLTFFQILKFPFIYFKRKISWGEFKYSYLKK